jgi:hypothetical protein
MPADTKTSVTTQVYEVYIRATPQAIGTPLPHRNGQ